MSLSRPLYPFVDWMKALGMGLIVYGHVADASTLALTPPIYLKQFGVAFFLFASGFTLARERRPHPEVVFNRLFQVYLFGLSFAALITLKGLMTGSGLALSNYSPLFGGANVLFDNFPANPTTWYLGTYLHLLLVWALWLRRFRVRTWMVAVALLIEIPVRALLITWAGRYVAYMLLTNWSAVFLLGMALGAEPETQPRGGAVPYAAALVGGVAAWGITMRFVGFDQTFPFMTLSHWPAWEGLLIVSATVSILYVTSARLLFEATRRIAAPAPIRFIARNSLIIFVGHMPLYRTLHPVLVTWGLTYWPRVGVQLLVCLPGLAIVSEALLAVVRPDRLRARVFEMLMTAGRGVAGHAGVSAPSWGDRRP